VVMTRVLLRARWMDKICQGMFFGWKLAYEQHRGTDRQLESTVRSLDTARRSAYNDRSLLMEFRSQSQRLQVEMTGEVERLQGQLTEADEEVDRVRTNLLTLTRQVYDDREKYDLSIKTADARTKELETKDQGLAVIRQTWCFRVRAHGLQAQANGHRREDSVPPRGKDKSCAGGQVRGPVAQQGLS